MPVIMGRKTYESMASELPGRINIIVTTQKDYRPGGTFVVNNLTDAIALAREAETREIFIIGGGSIFKDTMELTSRIYLTRVHVTLEGDTHYPEIDEKKWEKISAREHQQDARHNYAFTFEVWERK